MHLARPSLPVAIIGNIRQGPCGFVPAGCHCEPSDQVPNPSNNYKNIADAQRMLAESRMIDPMLPVSPLQYTVRFCIAW